MAYATPTDLATLLQKDVDTASAQLALDKASELFSRHAATWWTPTSTTYQTAGLGWTELYLPFRPINSITQVRVAGVVVTDYTRIKMVLYRLLGWGVPGRYPPDLIEVDLVHGYSTVPDDVKGVVLDMAASAYQSPDNTVAGESIDDYTVKFTDVGGIMLTESAAQLAERYRGLFVA